MRRSTIGAGGNRRISKSRAGRPSEMEVRMERQRQGVAVGVLRLAGIALVLTASCETPPPPRAQSNALNQTPAIGDFVLYAQRSITVGVFAQVIGGDLGVATRAANRFGRQLRVDGHARIDAAHS